LIGTIAALLIALSLGFALLVELRALRRVLTHANTTRHRVFKVESGRYRKSEQLSGTRAGVRADYEARILSYARSAVARLESIGVLLASLALPASVALEGHAAAGGDEDEDAERLTSKLPDEPGAIAAYIGHPDAQSAEGIDLEHEEELTNVWTGPKPARARREAEAGGATHHPSATPRAALSVAVAPPASAPPSTSPEPAILAAGLGRPRSARLAPHAPPSRVRTETLAGMPAPLLDPAAGDTSERTSWPSLKGGGVGLSTHTPTSSGPLVAAPRFPPTLVSMRAQDAAPEAIADETARLRLGPEDKTPPRRGRAAVLVPAYHGPEKGGAA
jgi:hypothetical protein